MRNIERAGGQNDTEKQGSAHSPDRDHSVPDLEVEPRVDGGSNRNQNRDPSRFGGFGGGQWLLLWFVIILGVTCGNLLSNYITSLAVAYQLQAVASDLTEGSEKASTEARQNAQAAAERR